MDFSVQKHDMHIMV